MTVQEAGLSVIKGGRMARPQHVSRTLWALLSGAWDTAAAKRPTFPELASALQELEANARMHLRLPQHAAADGT